MRRLSAMVWLLLTKIRMAKMDLVVMILRRARRKLTQEMMHLRARLDVETLRSLLFVLLISVKCMCLVALLSNSGLSFCINLLVCMYIHTHMLYCFPIFVLLSYALHIYISLVTPWWGSSVISSIWGPWFIALVCNGVYFLGSESRVIQISMGSCKYAQTSHIHYVLPYVSCFPYVSCPTTLHLSSHISCVQRWVLYQAMCAMSSHMCCV